MKLPLLIISILLINSCQPPLQKEIIGKWKVTETTIENYNDAFLEYKKTNSTNITYEDFKDLIISNYNNFFFDFNDSSVNINNEQIVKWTLTNNIIIIKTRPPCKLSIIEIFDNEIIADFYYSFNDTDITLKLILSK